MSDAVLRFLPWIPQGLVAGGSTVDPLSGPLPARQPVKFEIQINLTSSSLDVHLYGPGDITGIDTRQIIRTEPAANTLGFEPNYLATIEFDRPDFPWLFTPAKPDSKGRIRPWLFLVVLPEELAKLDTNPARPLPVLTCPRNELPDLSESWAWVHAQVALTSPDESVKEVLNKYPDRTLSRIICPRRLEKRTSYLACLVPIFEAGRLAGLGLPVPEGDLAPAWSLGDGMVDLPIYYHWRFTTASEEGDFESLVRRLQPRPLSDEVGVRPMDISKPGGGIEPSASEILLGLEGALSAPSMGSATFAIARGSDDNLQVVGIGRNDGLPYPIWQDSHNGNWSYYGVLPNAGVVQFQSNLEKLLETSSERLTPPIYGSIHADTQVLPKVGQEPFWLRELNLDPRHRIAAALGTRVIQEQQEDLMALAWDQAAKFKQANQVIFQGQLARSIQVANFEKRIASQTSRITFGDVQILQLAASTLSLIQTAPQDPRNRQTIADEIAQNITTLTTTSLAFRRITRPYGPIARRLTSTEDASLPKLVTNIATGKLVPSPTLVPPSGMVAFNAISGNDVKFADLVSQRILTSIERWWDFRLVRPIPPAPPVDDTPSTSVLTAPGGVMRDQQLFVGSTDGRLFELHYDGNRWLWFDHGTPPGARVGPVEPGGAIDNQCVFVASTTGHLFERYWDGDRWSWREYTSVTEYGNSGLSTAPSLLLKNPRSFLFSVYDYQRKGQLWYLRWVGNRWEGGSLGMYGVGGYQIPPVFSTPAALVEDRFYSSLFMSCVDGQLYEYQWSASTSKWLGFIGHGKPPGTEVVVVGPSMLNSKLFALVRDGRLFELYRAQPDTNNWVWVDHGMPPGTTVVQLGASGGLNNASVFVGTSDGRLFERQWNGNQWTWVDHGLPPGTKVAQPPTVVPGHGVFVSCSDGRLLRRWKNNNDWQWDDHGKPRDVRGIGTLDSEPKPHTRWALPLGFLSNFVIGYVDSSNRCWYRLGHNLDFDASVKGGWDERSQSAPWQIGAKPQGMSLTTADINRDGSLDLIVLYVDSSNGANRLYYRIGWTLNAAGDVTGGWSDAKMLPDPVSQNLQAVALATSDLDGDGNLELIVAYVTGGSTPHHIFYRIGWCLDLSGDVTHGWNNSREVPGSPNIVQGLGIAVADMSDNVQPDLVIMALELEGGSSHAYYRIGRRLNARGNVVGGWSDARIVGGAPFSAQHQGAGIAIADFTGSRKPDLVVFSLEKLAGASRGWIRVGWDLNSNGDARSWSESRPIPGLFSNGTQGGAIAIADLDGQLKEKRTKMGNAFLAAHTRHKELVEESQSLTKEISLPSLSEKRFAELASCARLGNVPSVAITHRLRARIELPPGYGQLDEPLRPLLAAPFFPQPMYEALRDLSQEFLFPGVANIPPETVTLLSTNSAFIEAFLVGLNHEFARELLWREYPANRRYTFFRQFWDVRGAVETVGPLTDIPPIEDKTQWKPSKKLGQSATAVGGKNMLVLMIRGEILKRYPSAMIYAHRAEWNSGKRELAKDNPANPTIRHYPQFHGHLQPDLIFFGMPLDLEAAIGKSDPQDNDAGWFFVIQQPPTAVRFGLNAIPSTEPLYGGCPATWDELHWGHLAIDDTSFAQLRHISVPIKPPETPQPDKVTTGLKRPRNPQKPGQLVPPDLGWGENAAHMAQITFQPPVQIALHASDLLSKLRKE